MRRHRGMKASVIAITAALALAACDNAGTNKMESEKAAPVLTAGIDYSTMDKSVRPQDDFHNYVNGTWLANTEIEGEFSTAGVSLDIFKEAENNQRKIIEDMAAELASDTSSEAYKIGAFYQSFMDEAAIEAAAATPLQAELNALASVSNKDELSAALARLHVSGVGTPFNSFIYTDFMDSSRYAAYIWQSGLTLPNRDYYLDMENERFKKGREAMPAYVAAMLEKAGVEDAAAKAEAVLAFETKLAEASWTAAASRDFAKLYNPHTMDTIGEMGDGLNWQTILEGMQLADEGRAIMGQVSFFNALSELAKTEDISTWIAYMQFKYIHAMAPYLSKDFVDTRFDFVGRTLSGQTTLSDRWKRGVRLTNGALGMAVGKIYVDRHFPPEAKARMMELVGNLKEAFHDGITNLEWMGDETRTKALDKLSKFTVKIGYPDVWKSYDDLVVDAGDLVGNIARSNAFDYAVEINKLGKPIDKTEWGMTPQTVNAYYSPGLNEIVFPAAILQPPYFDVSADDATNYGAIGAVIGHEIGHGFDDKGSTFDGDGNMKNWWTDDDRKAFEERTLKLIAQYDSFEALPGSFVQGKLTLGENIGDLSGLGMAYKAYQISLKKASKTEGPEMDGFTANQRFFLSWGQAWRKKTRPATLQQYLAADPHSPARYRVNGVVQNMEEFYKAFDVKEGDKHWLPPEERVRVW